MALYKGTGWRLVKSPKPASGAEAPRAADEGATTLVETEKAVGSAGNADAGALAQGQGADGGPGGAAPDGDGTQPERTGGAEVGAVEGAIYVQRGSQAARATGQIQQTATLAVLLHLADPFQGLEGTDKDAAPCSSDFGTDIEHEVIAVAEVDVGVAATQKHGAVALGWPTKVVGGRIALRIGLGFDNASTQADAG